MSLSPPMHRGGWHLARGPQAFHHTPQVLPLSCLSWAPHPGMLLSDPLATPAMGGGMQWSWCPRCQTSPVCSHLPYSLCPWDPTRAWAVGM